ncbi:MAG: putative DNA binding domain-containing protein [Eubacteriales bacterium]|nr:putative DNA binding domain-containing protein [Eubacteriales bacterium]
MNGKYIESDKTELKVRYSDTIVKEIVAFLNTEGGTIIIGVSDDGEIVGVSRVDETMQKLSDIITGQIEPNPQEIISTQLKFDEGKTLIVIDVPKGNRNIYCIKKYGFSSVGCPVRIGTTCREMTPQQIRARYELNILDHEYMLKVNAKYADISFRTFKVYYSEKGYHLSDSSIETNFNLRTEKGNYNLLAELLSDQNNIPLIFAKFKGRNKASISERSDYGHGCILLAYEKIKNRLTAENICVSDTSVRPRKDSYLFDLDCANEAVINAIVHNDWTVSEPLISFFEDRMEVFSHGGLPSGLSTEQFFGGVSKPRNATLMRIFMNMDITEHTGHGVPTIIERYGKEAFEITDSSIKCTIPFDEAVLSQIRSENVGLNVGLTDTEKKILKLLITEPKDSAASLSEKTGVSKRTAERALKSLREKDYISRSGSKRDGYWIVKK